MMIRVVGVALWHWAGSGWIFRPWLLISYFLCLIPKRWAIHVRPQPFWFTVETSRNPPDSIGISQSLISKTTLKTEEFYK
jgi:hypothetical protein